jgi:hypothetical protein
VLTGFKNWFPEEDTDIGAPEETSDGYFYTDTPMTLYRMVDKQVCERVCKCVYLFV